MTNTIKLMLLGVMVLQVSSCLLIISTMQTLPVGFIWVELLGISGLILGVIGYFRRDRPVPPHRQPVQPTQTVQPKPPPPPEQPAAPSQP